MSTTAHRLAPTDAPGSVSRAPRLPAGFTDTFASYLVDPGGQRALLCAFEFYRAIEQTVEQNIRRRDRRLQLPVLAIGGADGLSEVVAATMRLVADDVTPAVLKHCDHYIADEAPEGMLEVLEPFLAPYTALR